MKSLIAIPTYNEAENIAPIIDAVMDNAGEVSIVVIDDGSQDGTANIVKAKSQNYAKGQINIIERSGKLGLGTAYVAAFHWGLKNGFDIIVEMDADFSHDPKVLPIMLQELSNSPVVVGSRYIAGGGTRNWSLIRRLISRGGTLYTRMILGLPCTDATGGFNGWRREVLEAIKLDDIKSEGYAFQIELKYRAWKRGFTCKEIPICFEDRRAGESKMSYNIVLEAIWRVWLLRFIPSSEKSQ